MEASDSCEFLPFGNRYGPSGSSRERPLMLRVDGCALIAVISGPPLPFFPFPPYRKSVPKSMDLYFSASSMSSACNFFLYLRCRMRNAVNANVRGMLKSNISQRMVRKQAINATYTTPSTIGRVADGSTGFWQVSELPVVVHGVLDEELLVADLRACETPVAGSSPLPWRRTTFRMSK